MSESASAAADKDPYSRNGIQEVLGSKHALANLECLANHLDSEVHRCTFDILQRKLVHHQLRTVSLENPVHAVVLLGGENASAAHARMRLRRK